MDAPSFGFAIANSSDWQSIIKHARRGVHSIAYISATLVLIPKPHEFRLMIDSSATPGSCTIEL